MVVVARDDDHLRARGQRRRKRAQHRLGGRRGLVRAALEQFERVAEQDQAVDAGDRVRERRSAGGRRSTSRLRAEPRCRSEMTSVRTGCVTIGTMESLRGKLLIASPAIVDPHFRQTVVLLAEHTDEGAMGVVLNREADVTVGEAVPGSPTWRAATTSRCTSAAPSRPTR